MVPNDIGIFNGDLRNGYCIELDLISFQLAAVILLSYFEKEVLKYYFFFFQVKWEVDPR